MKALEDRLRLLALRLAHRGALEALGRRLVPAVRVNLGYDASLVRRAHGGALESRPTACHTARGPR